MIHIGNVLSKIEGLRRDLSAEIPGEGHYEKELVKDFDGLGGIAGERRDSYYYEEDTWVVDNPAEPNTKTRESAKNQLELIMDNQEEFGVVRYAAANALGIRLDTKFGYYPIRIFINNHPVTATVTGLAAAGAASGLVYALVEYFSK